MGTNDGFPARNLAWTALSVIATLVAALAVFDAIWMAVADGKWLALLGIPLVATVWFWVAVGAWERTTWGAEERIPVTPRK